MKKKIAPKNPTQRQLLPKNIELIVSKIYIFIIIRDLILFFIKIVFAKKKILISPEINPNLEFQKRLYLSKKL